MRTLLKAALMSLGAACVLLLAGGFPLLGAPELYRGGAMLLLGIIIGLLTLWGGLRLAKGDVARLLFGLFCCFMTGIGLVMIGQYGGKAIDYVGQGGIMWFGAIGMGCIATVGVIFAAIFGFFAKRLMLPKLWLAGVHVACFFVLMGACMDFCAEERFMERLPADGKTLLASTGSGRELPFRLRVDDFSIEYYEGSETCSLMSYDHANRRWQREGIAEQRGGQLVFGDERWEASLLRKAPGMPRPFLVVGQGRVLLQDAPAVREYRARCHVMTRHKGRDEARDEILRVNEPLAVKGWQVTLMSHESAAEGTPQLVLQLRRAPGRFWALTGMAGLILCTTCWCWQLGRQEKGKEEAHA